jgi:pectinesterase
MIVSADGSGDFDNLQAAIDAIPADNRQRVTIHISNGVYKQKVKIDKPYITLIGESASETILTFDDHAKRLFPDGKTMNTFNSYTLYIGGHDFHAENLTIENSAGSGKIVGQALAVYADADRISFKGCRFLGCQDTLFTGPLPKRPTPLGLNLIHPTLGSGEAEYTGEIRQYYEDCFIRGDIDFIFGSATAVFNRCEIYSNDRGDEINGYITAGSTSPHYRFGYVFLDCQLTGDAGPGSVYLGRPWRDHAKVSFINCRMGGHIRAEGWHNWDKPHREATVTYLESGSSGPGANDAARVKWAKILPPQAAKEYTVANILSGSDGWNPEVDAY